jgi:hypothetical protein
MLPPPDPNESPLEAGAERPLEAATAIYLGTPTPETNRVASRLLDLRPGLLIVLAR